MLQNKECPVKPCDLSEHAYTNEMLIMAGATHNQEELSQSNKLFSTIESGCEVC